MDEPIILNQKSDVRDYEIAIYQSEIDRFEKKIAALDLETKFEQEILDRALPPFQKIRILVNDDNSDSIELEEDVWHEIYDEAFERQNYLIRPSHSKLPYSLIRKRPELEAFVPYAGPRSVLELLTDRSTSRALEVINTHTSENTLRAHNGDLVYIQAWLSAVGFTFKEPITEKFITAFIVQHAEEMDSDIDQKLVAQGYKTKLGPHKLSTIKRRVK